MTELASPGQLRASLLRWSLVLVPGVELLGFLSSQIGDGADSLWFEGISKPAIFPPPSVFQIVWPILFALIALALALVVTARGASGRSAAITAWVVTFVLILGWSPLFFAAHEITAAFYLLLAIDFAALAALWLIWKVRPVAGMLFLPFVLWVSFAAVLNYQFMDANPNADGREVSGATQRIEI
jgi:tryptophan-rich sensory protein